MVEKGNQPNMRRAGDNNRRGEDMQRSCAYVSFGSAQIFSVGSNDVDQGEEFRTVVQGVSGDKEAVLGAAFLGEGVFRKYGRDR